MADWLGSIALELDERIAHGVAQRASRRGVVAAEVSAALDLCRAAFATGVRRPVVWAAAFARSPVS